MLKRVKPGFAIWITGLPSSGKTTIAQALKNLLLEKDVTVQVLDSDDLRQKLTPHPTYSPEERNWFYDLVSFLAELLTHNGVNVIIAATASRRAYRQAARARIKRFAEVYIDCSPEVCRARDSKGLWKKADNGEIVFFPGVGEPLEPPESPEVRLDSAGLSIAVTAHTILYELDKKKFFSSTDRTAGD
jgi:adenylylsulfate kinase